MENHIKSVLTSTPLQSNALLNVYFFKRPEVYLEELLAKQLAIPSLEQFSPAIFNLK